MSNTPRLITNNVGQAVWSWGNDDPFGANAPNENPSAVGDFTCNLRLPAQYFDRETSLHYNYFRDYEPRIGRYVQSDPIGLVGGPNTYLYAYDPLSQSDPSGLMGRGGMANRPSRSTVPVRFGGGGAIPGYCGTGWNEPFVPDTFGAIYLSSACKAHDECYSRCGSLKLECDLELRRGIMKECDKIPKGTGVWGFCKTLAVDYGVAVGTWGDSAFNAAQAKCTSCK